MRVRDLIMQWLNEEGWDVTDIKLFPDLFNPFVRIRVIGRIEIGNIGDIGDFFGHMPWVDIRCEYSNYPGLLTARANGGLVGTFSTQLEDPSSLSNLKKFMEAYMARSSRAPSEKFALKGQ